MVSVYKKYKSTWDKNFFVRGEIVKPGGTVELTEKEAADLLPRKKTVADPKTGKTSLIKMIEPLDADKKA